MKWLMLLAVLPLASCAFQNGTVDRTAEVVGLAAEALERDTQRLVMQSTEEIAVMGRKIHDRDIAAKWKENTDPEGNISALTAIDIANEHAEAIEEIEAMKQKKREEWADSPNLQLIRKLIAASRGYAQDVGGGLRTAASAAGKVMK